MYILGIFPAIVLITVAFPLNKVLKLALEHVAVQYCFNFIVFLSINQDRVQRGVTLSSWDWICKCRHQFDYREDGMQMAHGSG